MKPSPGAKTPPDAGIFRTETRGRPEDGQAVLDQQSKFQPIWIWRENIGVKIMSPDWWIEYVALSEAIFIFYEYFSELN